MIDIFIDSVNDKVCLYLYVVGPPKDSVPLEPHNEFCYFKKYLLRRDVPFVLSIRD